jgi:hypothetical protein
MVTMELPHCDPIVTVDHELPPYAIGIEMLGHSAQIVALGFALALHTNLESIDLHTYRLNRFYLLSLFVVQKTLVGHSNSSR